MKLNRTWSWLLVGGVCACTVVLAVMFFSALGDKSIGWFGKLTLLTFGVVAIAAVLIAGGRIVEPGKGIRGFLTPKTASLALLAVMTAFGSLTDVYGLLAPRPATESAPGQIEQNTREILERMKPTPEAPARILSALPGLWGEPGCSVVHRFRIEGEAVIMEEVGYDYRSVATIDDVDGDTMKTTTVEPQADRGASSKLFYSTNGVTETLEIQDLRTEVSLVLDRCNEEAK